MRSAIGMDVLEGWSVTAKYRPPAGEIIGSRHPHESEDSSHAAGSLQGCPRLTHPESVSQISGPLQKAPSSAHRPSSATCSQRPAESHESIVQLSPSPH